MSEFINNVSKRKETIKNILKQLNAGRTIQDVRAEFGSLLDETDAPSIVEVEQMLIEEGMPAEEIQRLCDIHANFFRESLDRQPTPESTPGHPIYTFRAENLAAEEVLADLEAALKAYQEKPGIQIIKVARDFVQQLMKFDAHYVRKENLLFPFLENYGFYGPSRVMWGIHNDIRAAWKQLEGLLTSTLDSEKLPTHAEINAIFEPMATAIREMFYKEEKILFTSALERLTEEDWKQIRSQENDAGYFVVIPGNKWPTGVTEQPTPSQGSAPEKMDLSSGLIPLQTGALTGVEIDLMLRTLPVDITYVDADDTVRYFSQTNDRIFQRSPAIIGRKVQNCHPPQSLNKVQQIVDDFRAGTRDHAEFWIQMGEKFVVIQYHALRDENQKYLGTLEVSMDAAHLRSLQGERRLLDDGKS
jgi:DUF438 domain-containing protein